MTQQNNPLSRSSAGTPLHKEKGLLSMGKKPLWDKVALIMSIAFLFFMAQTLYFKLGHAGHKSFSAEATFAVIPISDVITTETTKSVRKKLRFIQKKENFYQGVLLDLNSPGGTAAASEEIFEELKLFKKNTKMPIVASIRDMGTSGAYFIASAADYIVANAGSITGSIGVILSTFNVKELADKIGVEPIVIKTGKMKDTLSPFRKVLPEELAYLQTLAQESYEIFLNAVDEGRKKMTIDQIRPYADGRIFTGKKAKELGLIDFVGGMSVAEKVLAKMLKVSDFESDYLGEESFLASLSKQLSSLSSQDSFLTKVTRMLSAGNSVSLPQEEALARPTLYYLAQ